MLYLFVERNDAGAKVVAKANVLKSAVKWSGSKAKAMRDLLADTTWQLLGNRVFDEKNPKHWKKLPELITGSRLWVETG